MTDGWIQADELQDRRLDNLEQRLIMVEETLTEMKAMLRMLKTLGIAIGSLIGLNVHQLML
jgi:hypothetical protein